MKEILPVLLVLVLVLVFLFITTRNSKFGALGGVTPVTGSSDAYKYIKILFTYTNPVTNFGTNSVWNGLVLYLDKQKLAAGNTISIPTTKTQLLTGDALKSKANYLSATTDAQINGSINYGNMFFNAIGFTDGATNNYNSSIYQSALNTYYYQPNSGGSTPSAISYGSAHNSAPVSGTRYYAFVTAARTYTDYFNFVQATYNYYTYAAPVAIPEVTQPGNADAVTLKKFTGGTGGTGGTGSTITNTSNYGDVSTIVGTNNEIKTADHLTLLKKEVLALLTFIKVFKPAATITEATDNSDTTSFYVSTDETYDTVNSTDIKTASTAAVSGGAAASPVKVYGRTLARKYMNLSTGEYIFGVAIINNRLTYNTNDRYRFPFTISDIEPTTVSLDIGLAPIYSTSASDLTAAIVYA